MTAKNIATLYRTTLKPQQSFLKGIKSEANEIFYIDLVINKYNIGHIVFILEKKKKKKKQILLSSKLIFVFND